MQDLPWREPRSWRLPRKLRRSGYTMLGHCLVRCRGGCGFACSRPIADCPGPGHRKHICSGCRVSGPDPSPGHWPWCRPLRWSLPRACRGPGVEVVGWCKQPCARGCGLACSRPLAGIQGQACRPGHRHHECARCSSACSPGQASDVDVISVSSGPSVVDRRSELDEMD